ncbi:DUF3085 domain-containing protein [Pseudomonas chlororaphis]|uniref:DUF3085 domain-containing protein n=1 Tax=Pseudomonas chlororaphis TaxID=587753 RepID=UPI0030CD8FFD
MSLRFRNADLRPVLAEALANKCRVILVKDEGVYWLSEHGERLPNGHQKLLAYAVGCNPNVDSVEDWYELARNELGGDDFAEYFDMQERIMRQILDSNDDLKLVATATKLTLTVIAPESERS